MPLLSEWTADRRALLARSAAEARDAEEILGTSKTEADAPSGWWLVPAVIGGMMAWAWLVWQALRLIDRLFL